MMRINQGNVLKVIHTTSCTWQQAEEALKNTNSWSDVFKYAKQLVGE